MNEPDLVYIDEYDLLGSNYYWNNRDKFNLSIEDLFSAGVIDSRVMVHKQIIEPLKKIDEEFSRNGYRIYISEGYRPKVLYELVYQKRIEQDGKEMTDRLINMADMPHSTGKTVDVTLWDINKNVKLRLRDDMDGIEAMFVNFYKGKAEEPARKYHELQTFIIHTMLNHGFEIGKKHEYFHFNFAEH